MKKLLSALFGLFVVMPVFAATLPAGYVELEYIESNGTQYIDTGIVPTDSHSYGAKFVFDSLDDTGCIIGAEWQAAGSDRICNSKSTNQIFCQIDADNIMKYSANTQIGTMYDVSRVSNKFTCNNEQQTATYKATSTKPIYLMASPTRGAEQVQYLAIGKMYYAKIWNNGTLVRDFVPAKYGTTVGLYDVANNQFYSSAASNTNFAAGPATDPCSGPNLISAAPAQTWSQNGITMTTTGNGVYTISGTATAYTEFAIPIKEFTIPYSLRGNTTGPGSFAMNNTFKNSDIMVSFYYNDNTHIDDWGCSTLNRFTDLYNTMANKVTNKILISIASGTTVDGSFAPAIYNDGRTSAGTFVAGCQYGSAQVCTTYTTATGTVTQSPNPTPSAPVTPTFYTQGGMTLRAVGTGSDIIADSYDATTGKITRRVGYKVLDGTEEWAAYSSISGLYYSEDAITNNKLDVPSLDIASTHFAATDSPNLENNGTLRFQQATGNPSLVTTHRLYLRNTAAANVTAFKQWLASQYAAGTPVIIYYPLATATEEDWAATQCTAANTCNNLFDASAATSGHLINISNGQPILSSSSNFASDYIAVTGGAKYTLNRTTPTATNGLAWYDAGKTYISGQKYDGSNGQTFTAPANAAYVRFSIYNGLSGVKFEQGETATEYCTYRGKIKIATTKYNNTAFQPVLTALNNAVSTIKDVVANTINQATAVANLQSDKQRRPNPTDTNGTCPNYRQCLLVEDQAGTPHWFEIMDPFYNLFSAVVPNNVSALSVASASGEFTQLEYIQSNGSQYLDTGITMVATDDIEIRFARNDTNGATASFFGYMPASNNVVPRMCFGSTYQGVFAAYNGTYYVVEPLDTDFHTARIWYENGRFYNSAGVEYSTSISGTMGTAYIFARHGTNGVQVSDGGGTKISYIIWKDVNGNLKAHYVAARRSDGVLGMYDLKTGNFLTNLGSGSFTASTNLASPSLLPNRNSWNATFGANDTYGYGRSIVYGTATCNATSGTANTAATSNQMSNANWTATGNNCWCHIERVDETATGNTGLSTGNIWVWLAVPSGETCGGDCASNCADAVASGAAANKAFRKALTGM